MSELLGGAGPLRLRLFAALMARFGKKTEVYLGPYKQKLFAPLTGTVLEIGPGTGVNLPYFAKDRVRWMGVEPNPFMRAHLEKEAAALGLDADLRDGTAEHLTAADESVDAVISTLVLCSVTDQRLVLEEIKRVLKPGGKFVFIEHVAAPRGTFLRRIQRWVLPFWKRMGDGCHPDRETWVALEQAGFRELQIERFDAPMPVVKPHIAGVAVK